VLNHANLQNADLTRARMLETEIEHVKDKGCNYTLSERA
jgi:uncharacterized protein YjbI with pentapeptide repeats